MRIVGVVSLGIALWIAFLKRDFLSIHTLILGISIGISSLILAIPKKTSSQSKTLATSLRESEIRFRELEFRTSQELEKKENILLDLQNKVQRLQERCDSYQKLILVHQSTADHLKEANQKLNLEIIEKGRILNTLQMESHLKKSPL